jgi:eukaryotic-like serine/threonine-protein kinase
VLPIRIPGVEAEGELGRGAYSVVFRARHAGRPCAVKVPRWPGRSHRWFRREAVALARVNDPGLPGVMEVGEVEGIPYLVMELAEGVSLAERLRHGPLSEEETRGIASQLCRTLGAVHCRGLVHRDIKPGNIVFDPESGNVRLVDFGFVTQMDRSNEVGAAGTRAYAAPEQLADPQVLDGRADLFALGGVLFECLTGRRIAREGSWPGPAAIRAQLVDIGVSEGLAHIVAGLMAVDPAQRYATSAAVARDLQRIERGLAPLGSDAEGPGDAERLPIMGRDRELQHLRQRWRRAHEGMGSVVLVRGPAGSGKSRLLQAFLEEVHEGTVLEVRCEITEPAPLSALSGMFDDYVRSVQGMSEPDRDLALRALRSSARGPLAPLMGLVSRALATVIDEPGLPELPPDMHEAFVEGVAEFVRRFASELGPVIVAVDDLQWVDPVSREILLRVAHRAEGLPLLFVATARSEEADGAPLRRFVESLSGGRLDTLDLSALSGNALTDLLAAYLGSTDLGAELSERVASLSDGTPLSALELLEAFVDHGVLAPHWGGWRFDPDAAEQMQLPSSALAILQHRLAGLPPACRRVLEAAAVAGHTFEDALVAQVTAAGLEGLGHAVSEARRRGLLQPVTRNRHRFVHERVREAFLAGLSTDQRRSIHARIASALDAGVCGDRERIYGIATHYALGSPETDPHRGLEVTRLAADCASGRFDNETALRFFDWARSFAERAGVSLGADDHRKLGETQLRIGALRESLAAFEDAYGLVSGGAERAEVLGRISWVHHARGATERAWQALGQAFHELGAHMPDEGPRSVSRSAASWLSAHVRPPIRSRAPRLDARQERRSRILCDLLYQNARLAIEHGRTLTFVQSTLSVLDVASQLGPSRTLAKSYALYGFTMFAGLRRRDLGLSYLKRAQVMAEQTGDPSVFAYCLQLHSIARYWIGQIDEGTELMRQCLDEHGHWLEASEYCVNVFNPHTVEAMRGRPAHELAWVERAIGRIRRAGRTPSVFAVVEESARAVLAAMDRDRDAETLLDGVAPVEDEAIGFHGLLLWSARIRRLTERGDLGPEFEALVERFEAEGHDPKKAHLVLAEYYVHVAHARVHQCLRASGAERDRRMADLGRAAEDLRGIARIPLVKSHLHVVSGFRALLRDDSVRARRELDKAERLAEQQNAPWIMYSVARAEAHLLRREGRPEVAREKARIAAMLAREQGAVHRVRFIAEEFDLRATPPPTSASAPSEIVSSSTRSARRRRQLQTLLQIVRMSSRELNMEQQAREVTGELLQTLEAERALLIYEGGEGQPMRIVAGAEGVQGHDHPGEAEVVCHVQATGEVFMGEEPPSGMYPDPPADRGSLLAVPLVLKERVLGAVCLQRGASASPFEADDRDLLVALSYQVLSALELTRLLEQRERLEQSLRQAQKMEAVGRLAGGVAHDFNNMLTVIEASVEALRDQSGADGDSTSDLEMIQNAAQRAKALTRRLLAFSRRQVLRPAVYDPNLVLQELAPMLRRLIGEHIKVDLDLTPDVHPVKIDRSSFEQAMVNLAANARDAMPKGGALSLRTRNVDLDAEWSEQHAAGRSGPHVLVSVSDTGEGMTPDIRARIFDPFFTTKLQSGTGLGLSMVYGFTTQSHGHIEVESEVGRGTSFHLYLPRPREALTRPSTIPPKPMARHATETVLLVEDERLVRNSVRRILAREGYTVLTAEGGKEALALVEQHGASIAVVISDVLMPDMSGPELVSKLRGTLPSAKYLYISGYTDGHLVAQGVLEQEVALLQKPFTSAELRQSLRDLLGDA